MERYKILAELGNGSCGNVYKARDMRTYEIVAVKKLKRRFYFWEEYTKLREIKALRKMNHPNIIKLKEVVWEDNELFFIFEYMENSLYEVMKARQRPFSKEEMRRFMSQLFQGLSHMHRVGYFHRDLKPENLLVTNNFLKIADFGLAREVSSMPPYTQYVSTRWYRAPEVLLHSPYYTPAIDMWAAGAIMAELYLQSPIFPGESEIDQLYKICNILGSPDWATCFEMNASPLLDSIGYEMVLPANLSDLIPTASPDAIDLIKQLLSWNPSRRPSADASLQHPFFQVETWVPYSLRDPLELKLSTWASTKPNLELKLHDFGPDPDECFLGLTLGVKPSISSLDMVHGVSQAMGEVFRSSMNNQSDQPVFWSLISPGQDENQAPVDSSLSLSFSSIQQHPPIGVPESTGFSIQSSLQPSFLSATPFLALSSPYQQSHYS